MLSRLQATTCTQGRQLQRWRWLESLSACHVTTPTNLTVIGHQLIKRWSGLITSKYCARCLPNTRLCRPPTHSKLSVPPWTWPRQTAAACRKHTTLQLRTVASFRHLRPSHQYLCSLFFIADTPLSYAHQLKLPTEKDLLIRSSGGSEQTRPLARTSLRDLSFSQRFCEGSVLQGYDAVTLGEWFSEFKDRTASTWIHITQGVVDISKKGKVHPRTDHENPEGE